MSGATRYPDVAQRFAAETGRHEMTVLHDDGLYRHLRFKAPGTFSYFFDLVTWPGCLTIRGDMGTFTFARVDDMLGFFLSGGDINPQYWEEKLQGGREDARSYNPSTFRWLVGEAYQGFREEHPESPHLDDLWRALREEVLETAEYTQGEAIGAAVRFEHRETGFTLAEDVWDWRVNEFSIFYLWCCFAIRWGAGQYVAAKAGQAVSS